MGLKEGRVRIAPQEGEPEHGQESGVDKQHPGCKYPGLAIGQLFMVLPMNARKLQDLGEIMFQNGAHWEHGKGHILGGQHPGKFLNLIQPVKVPRLEIIKTSLVSNKKEDQDTGGQSDGKTNNINRRKDLVLPKVAPGDLEIVFNHEVTLKKRKGVGVSPERVILLQFMKKEFVLFI